MVIDCADAFASKLRSYRAGRWPQIPLTTPKECGSGLARESGVSGDMVIDFADAFASKLRSYRAGRWAQIPRTIPNQCGSGLARESVSTSEFKAWTLPDHALNILVNGERLASTSFAILN
ncbi:hypothetical protein [Pseudomonas frederiksbergensis]|nr:hypothetical protein [Pseudomonas frederiksbergensis]